MQAYITHEHPVAIAPPSGFTVTTGAVVPANDRALILSRPSATGATTTRRSATGRYWSIRIRAQSSPRLPLGDGRERAAVPGLSLVRGFRLPIVAISVCGRLQPFPTEGVAMKDGIHPDYHEITVLMTDGTTYKTRLNLRQGRRHAAPRHRLEVASSLDGRPAAPFGHRRPARPLQQTLPGLRTEVLAGVLTTPETRAARPAAR